MPPRSLIGRRPVSNVAADRWVRRGDDTAPTIDNSGSEVFAARLTVDVTQELRGRIKIAAFRRGSTVANLLRQVLQREFGDAPEKT